MTKDDYMKLSKERLAELLAERDAIPFVPLQTWQTPVLIQTILAVIHTMTA